MTGKRGGSSSRRGGRGRRRGRKGHGGGGGGGSPKPTPTSHTGRAALANTRAWLLKNHGPVCAYCAGRFTPKVMTLDHVAPRRGQIAYDRRDNIVLACPACNQLKRDMAPLAFLLARRSRAANLLQYGTHLSPMLVDLARSLVPGASDAEASPRSDDDFDWSSLDDGRSPYRD